MSENNNISKNGWSEYGRLVLNELERLNDGQEKLREDFEKKLNEINERVSEFKSVEKDITEMKKWKENVTEVWSPSQMKQSKDEIYEQKNKWSKVVGIVLAIQIIFSLILAFKEFIFK